MPGVFFLGLGLTFGFLYLIKNERNKLEWAKIPALILIIFSGFVFFNTTDSFLGNLILPLSLIASGGYLIHSATGNKSVQKKLEST